MDLTLNSWLWTSQDIINNMAGIHALFPSYQLSKFARYLFYNFSLLKPVITPLPPSLSAYGFGFNLNKTWSSKMSTRFTSHTISSTSTAMYYAFFLIPADNLCLYLKPIFPLMSHILLFLLIYSILLFQQFYFLYCISFVCLFGIIIIIVKVCYFFPFY